MCVYTHMHISTLTHIYMHIHSHICKHTHIHTDIYIYVHKHYSSHVIKVFVIGNGYGKQSSNSGCDRIP